jgi:hypothetical protein
MSASNWTKCPRCILRNEKAAQAERERVADAYGKIPAEQWLELSSSANVACVSWEEDATFREDYEIIGASSGEVEVIYSGHCADCGLNVAFKHSVKIEGIAA